MRKSRLAKVAVIISLLALMFLLPKPANAGVADIVMLLKTITTTLREAGTVLNTIRSARTSVTNLEQQVVWPLNLINQAKSFVAGMHMQYAGLTLRVYGIPLNSATLPNAVQFESVLRGGQVGNLSQIGTNYSRIYQPLPQPADARAKDRNLMDADDAIAIGALKTAVIADQGSQSTLSVADVLERQASGTAPGAASLLTAQAQATDLQNQAILHRLLAAELREEAAILAHGNALRKRRTESATNLRNQLQQILTR